MHSSGFIAPSRAQHDQDFTPRTSNAVAVSLRSRALLLIAAGITFALTFALLAAPAHAALDQSPTKSTGSMQSKTAHAEAHKKSKASLAVSASKRTYTKGSKPTTLRILARMAGKPVTGKVKIYDGAKKLATRAVSARKAKTTYRLPRSLQPGKHSITVKFTASATQDGASAKARRAVKKLSITIRPAQSRGQLITALAKRHIGVAYRRGGSSPSGFDCSGFTSYVYKKAGIARLPKSSSAQRTVGKRVSRAHARPGDLIWTPGHVAIYLGGNKQIDAPRPGKTIKVRSIWQHNPTFIRV